MPDLEFSYLHHVALICYKKGRTGASCHLLYPSNYYIMSFLLQFLPNVNISIFPFLPPVRNFQAPNYSFISELLPDPFKEVYF